MDMIDYTGKLNTHEEYIKILNKLENKTKYIEIVIINNKNKNDLVFKFKDNIIETKKVSEWWGTITKGTRYLYKIIATKEIFTYLRKFETFTKYYKYGSNNESLKRGDYSLITDFGMDDIAFFDKDNVCLLCTTTHEGYILINKKL
ncbi:MAG: hypothetical protein IJD92_02130 [Bacilli bacterium]|nr:hypothetical protein [Bacilli bacterium]